MRLCLRNLSTVSQAQSCLTLAFSRHHRHSSPPWLDYRETQLTSESTTSFPMFQPNDTIWVRWVGKDTRIWKGPYMVILSTPTAVKIAGILPWTRHTQVKKAEAADAAKWSLWIMNPLKLRSRRAPKSFHSIVLKPLLSLTFGMNTRSCSNLHST